MYKNFTKGLGRNSPEKMDDFNDLRIKKSRTTMRKPGKNHHNHSRKQDKNSMWNQMATSFKSGVKKKQTVKLFGGDNFHEKRRSPQNIEVTSYD